MESMSKVTGSVAGRAASWLVRISKAVLMLAAAVPGPGLAAEIVGPSGSPKPQYSKAHDPSAAELAETWRSSNNLMPLKRTDRERFEIIDRRVSWSGPGRAFLQFRILPADGEASAFAKARCHGRPTTIEMQVFFQWSRDLSAWVPQATHGDGDEDLCGSGPAWSEAQIAYLIDPPPLPEPPKIDRRDVVTPPQGSPERNAILDGIRPLYEALFGKPIQLRVEKMRAAAGFAYVIVHPQRPSAAPIELSAWRKAFGSQCFQTREGIANEYWMKKTEAGWVSGVKHSVCADDTIVGEGDLIGAPPQLADKNAWPAREFRMEGIGR
jgi:hypothetical protein